MVSRLTLKRDKLGEYPELNEAVHILTESGA